MVKHIWSNHSLEWNTVVGSLWQLVQYTGGTWFRFHLSVKPALRTPILTYTCYGRPLCLKKWSLETGFTVYFVSSLKAPCLRELKSVRNDIYGSYECPIGPQVCQMARWCLQRPGCATICNATGLSNVILQDESTAQYHQYHMLPNYILPIGHW